MNDKYALKPILKWAGGKTQLLGALHARMPKEYNVYYEPFIGGGALLSRIKPRHAVINDINPQLINLYRQLQGNSTDLIRLIEQLDKNRCDKDFFLKKRNEFNEKISEQKFDVECAALMVWLNKHCFNGLYRVNKDGLFNVPYNNRITGASIEKNNLINWSNFFEKNNVSILCCDFEEACKDVKKGDFVYFDSPYIPESKTANFTTYAKNGFDYADHIRLSNLFKKLDSIGAKVMLSNNDVPLIYDLYENYNISSISARRLICRDASKRNSGREVIITNY